MKWVLSLTMTGALLACTCMAQQPVARVTIPVKKTSATSGQQMFANYCAPCHGVDGKGQGPVSSALKATPTDLTALAKSNHGKYPDAHIMAVLQNGVSIASHGTPEMPVWGPILGKMSQSSSQGQLLRMSNLSRYLESIQVK